MSPESRAFSRSDAPRIGVVGAGGLGVHHVRILRDLCGDRFAGFVDEKHFAFAIRFVCYGISVSQIRNLMIFIIRFDYVFNLQCTRGWTDETAMRTGFGVELFAVK